MCITCTCTVHEACIYKVHVYMYMYFFACMCTCIHVRCTSVDGELRCSAHAKDWEG